MIGVLPVVRSVGAVSQRAEADGLPGVPAGTIEGDLLITVVSSGGSATDLLQSGYTKIRTVKNGTDATDAMLTVFWKIAGASESTVNVTGITNHVIARSLCIQKGTFNRLNPIHGESGGNVQGDTTSVSISGLTTTKDNCLVLAFSAASLPDANSTAQYGSWVNASLSNLIERMDNNTTSGNGGGVGVLEGTRATAGTVSATTATKASSALLANLMIAIEPEIIPETADFSPHHTVIDGNPAGWDAYFENVSCVVKFNDTYFLYYIGGDTDADEGDDWVYNRQVGVATSPDMVNWTKYGSNPILSFTPEGDQPEEGIGDCKCVVYDGKIHMYYSALRWRSGGDVDVEIRYRVSTDGFTFTDDTLIIDDLDEELYASGVYVTPGGTFHLWYAGPLTGGVGDLKKLSGSDPASLSSDGTITTNDYSSRGGIVPIDADNLLFFNDRFFDGSITCTLIKTAALGALSTVFPAIDFNGGGAALDVPGCFFYEDGQWFEFSIRSSSATAPFDTTQIVMRTSPELPAFELAASSNIAASAATATTAIMSAPAGKTTGDFDAGTISDDTNPLPSVNLTDDGYTELEWCLQATAYAGPDVVYEFRVSDDGAALDTYTDLPEWTIEEEVEAVDVAPEAVIAHAGIPSPTLTLGALPLTPDPASGEAVLPTPTVVLGAISLAPSAAVGEASLPQPDLTLGALTLAPESVIGEAVLPSSTIALGTLGVMPGPVVTEGILPSPTIDSAVTIAPVSVLTEAALPTPSIVLGTLALTPAPVIAEAVGPQMTVVAGLSIAATPVFAEAILSVPSIVLGTVSLEPDPVTTEAQTLTPSLAAGTEIQPSPISGHAVLPQATMTLGTVTMTPSPVVMVAAIPDPLLTLGPVGVFPSPGIMTAFIPDPQLVHGQLPMILRATNERLSMPGVTGEALGIPQQAHEALRLPGITNEALIES